MAPKKNSGPMLFCEWVIGGPLPKARRAMKPKPKPKPPAPLPPPSPPRDVIRVEVTTDDEKEEDTLKITFPRSGWAAAAAVTDEKATAEAVVKKVRFKDEKKNKKNAKKSAMKQPKSDESDSSATLAEGSSDGESSSSSKEEAKKGKSQTSGEESDSDSEPHPTCKCSRCAKRRKKSAKQSKDRDSASESEESATSEDEKVKPKEAKKGNKKQEGQPGKQKEKQKGKKKDNSDADDEASESGKDTTDDGQEANDKKPETKGEKKKDAAAEKSKKQKQQQEKAKGKEKGESSKPSHEKEPAAPPKPSPFSSYPEAFPGPHARRPNLIAPIRAQVVQTEDVVETPDDPPPNAFYDAAANIMRVYYGPVYGNHNPQQRSLYPRRDAAGRPLPVGVPHPTQNPYYYGFQNVPGYDGATGMPPEWHAGFGGQPPGFPPFVVNPAFQQQQQQQQQQQNSNMTGNKGVFSKNLPAAAPAPSVSQADDKAGASNVLPTTKIDEKKTTSPYYTPSKTAAELRNGSHRNSPAKSTAAPDNSNNNQNDANTSSWDSAPAQDSDTWGDGATNNDTSNNNNTDSWNTGGGNDGNTSNNWSSADNNGGNDGNGDSWGDNNANNGGGDSWGTNDNAAQSGGDNAVGWDTATSEAPPADDSNVMPGSLPGSWDATEPVPAWGDASAAQSTNGAATTW